jgi:hypothetical protein
MTKKKWIPVVALLLIVACKGDEATTATQTTGTRPQSATSELSATSADQSTKVTVHITGLTTLGDVPGSAQPQAKMLYVLNVRDDKHAPHVPVVMARSAFAPASDRTIATNGDYRVVELNGDALSFQGIDMAKSALTYDETAPKNGICPTEAEKKSLYFIPRMRRIVPESVLGHILGQDDLDPAHVRPEAGSKLIAGWIEMNYGTITAGHKNDIVWDFKESEKSKATHRQMIAQEALWEFYITGDTLTLTSERGSTRENVLQLKANGGRIELYFVNAPQTNLNDLIAGRGARHHSEDPHFEHYYEYFKAFLEKPLPRYHPFASALCVAGTLNEDRCALYMEADIQKPEGCDENENFAVGEDNCGPDGQP